MKHILLSFLASIIVLTACEPPRVKVGQVWLYTPPDPFFDSFYETNYIEAVRQDWVKYRMVRADGVISTNTAQEWEFRRTRRTLLRPPLEKTP